MPEKMDANLAAAVSTNSNTNFLWSVFLGETIDPVYGKWVDPLTLSFETILDLRKRTFPIAFNGNAKITTIAYEYYGTTSVWAILLYLNGYMHPDEIPSGATLMMPSRSDIEALIAATKSQESNYGKVYLV